METWDLTQTTINILEWTWDIIETIWNPFTSPEWFFNAIMDNSVRFWWAVITFLLRLAILIWVIFLIIAFTPIIWLILYIAIRPQWWRWDKTARRDTLFQKSQICENCWEFNQINNLYCTKCWEALHTTCHECQNKFSNSYSYCPNCWAPSLEQ